MRPRITPGCYRMASITFREMQALEEFLEMSHGYVLDFTDRTFASFFADFQVDIDDSRYSEGHSGSKANRLRSFLKQESYYLVGRVIHELIEYAESYRPGHPKAEVCRAIARRLLATEDLLAGTQQGSEYGHRIELVRQPDNRPAEIFLSYAHEDEQLVDIVRQQFVVYERLGYVMVWYDRRIPAGDEWRARIDEKIFRAHGILLFLSPDFLASRYCYEIEGEIALQRHREGNARVIPVILRPCDWVVTPFGQLQALPKDGTPLSQFDDKDQAALKVARGVLDSIGITKKTR